MNKGLDSSLPNIWVSYVHSHSTDDSLYFYLHICPTSSTVLEVGYQCTPNSTLEAVMELLRVKLIGLTPQQALEIHPLDLSEELDLPPSKEWVSSLCVYGLESVIRIWKEDVGR